MRESYERLGKIIHAARSADDQSLAICGAIETRLMMISPGNVYGHEWLDVAR